MATIGIKTIDGITEQIGKMLMDYQKELDIAFTEQDENEKLHIGLGVDIVPGEATDFKIDFSLSFILKKIKDKSTIFVDETQRNLFEGEEGE